MLEELRCVNCGYPRKEDDNEPCKLCGSSHHRFLGYLYAYEQTAVRNTFFWLCVASVIIVVLYFVISNLLEYFYA